MDVNLPALTLAAILSVLPKTADQQTERARLDPLAAAIAAAVLEAPALPFAGDGAPLASSLALATIAWHESGFDPKVLDCRRRGTRGDATAFQLLGPMARGPHTVEELCASYRLAAERALAVLVVHARRCKWGGFASMLGGYGRGSCGAEVKARLPNGRVVDIIAARCNTFDRLLRANRLKGECYRSGDIVIGSTP